MNQPAQLRYASLSQALSNIPGKVVGDRIIVGRDRFVVVPSYCPEARMRAMMPLLPGEDWPCPVALAEAFA